MLRVKQLFKEKGLTMSDVAAKMNMTAPGLSQALSRNMTLDVLNRIADAIGVETWELFTESTVKGDVNGFVEVKGEIYKVSSKEDIEKLLKLL